MVFLGKLAKLTFKIEGRAEVHRTARRKSCPCQGSIMTQCLWGGANLLSTANAERMKGVATDEAESRQNPWHKGPSKPI